MNSGRNVLPVGLDVGPGNNFRTNCRLNWDFKVLPGDNLLELGSDFPSPLGRKVLVGNKAQCINLITVQQDINLHQAAWPVVINFIIQRSIPPGRALQLIKEVKDDFRQWNVINHVNPGVTQVLHRFKNPPFTLAELHYWADIIIRHHDGGLNKRFLNILN